MREGRRVPVTIASSKIIHQHRNTADIPTVYHSLMASWRSTYPNWLYVLWDDESNLKLVEAFFPEWRNAYNALPSETYRADFARNLYMYLFGGMYADLNSEAISPLEPILAAQVLTKPPIAFLGMMQTSTAHLHSIPTAFMASSAPGHPLWLKSAQDAVDWARARSWGRNIPGPEHATGPVALRRSIMNYSPLSLELAPILPAVPFPSDTLNHSTPQMQLRTVVDLTPAACKKMTGARWVVNFWEH
ncbi:hypothetical protein FRC09_003310 [Ceratobasidium sp. 395]|nr:hypothetical protein FRC09_003310 [Ceratobasidium sp. 395]